MIFGLPAHPLLVHFAIGLLVLVPLGVLVSVAWTGMRNRLDWLLPLGAVAACVIALVTGQAGDLLESSLPQVSPVVAEHANWGQWTMRCSIAFAVLTVAWWASVTEHPLSWADRPFLRSRAARLVLTIAVSVVAAATLVLVMLTGHAGAVAVWG